jgi:hypothetical protein
MPGLNPLQIQTIGEITGNLFQSISQYAQAREREVTEREKIQADLRKFTLELDTKRELFTKYFEDHKDKKQQVLDEAKKILDLGIQDRDQVIIKAASDLMVQVLQNNVLKDFKSLGGGRDE